MSFGGELRDIVVGETKTHYMWSCQTTGVIIFSIAASHLYIYSHHPTSLDIYNIIDG